VHHGKRAFATIAPAGDVGGLSWRKTQYVSSRRRRPDVKRSRDQYGQPGSLALCVSAAASVRWWSLTSVSSLMTVGRCLLNNVVFLATLEDMSRDRQNSHAYVYRVAPRKKTGPLYSTIHITWLNVNVVCRLKDECAGPIWATL